MLEKTEKRTSKREVTVGEFIHINTCQQQALQYHIPILAWLIQHLANNTNNAGTNPDLTIKFLTKILRVWYFAVCAAE